MNKIKAIFKKINTRSLKHGSFSFILIAVVVAIVLMVNLTINLLGDKKVINTKIDLTSNKLFSIGDTTKNLLKGLKKDVTVYGLVDDAKVTSDYKQLTEVLNQYAGYGHVQVIYRDPVKYPTIYKEINPSDPTKVQDAEFVVKCGNKLKALTQYDLFDYQQNQQDGSTQVVGSKAEQGFSGAIKYVTADVTPTVYFTIGHSENDLATNYTMVKQQLSLDNYDVKTVNLLMVNEVPKDAKILVVASPKKDFTVNEREKVSKYLENNGKAVFLLDSLKTDVQFPELENLLRDYNISINYDIVQEKDGNRANPQNPQVFAPTLQDNDINGTNLADFFMIMTDARSLNVLKNQKQDLTITSLAKTSDKSVGVQINSGKGKDINGPLDVAIYAEHARGTDATKVLVIGNADFVSDTAYQTYGTNGLRFFMHTLSLMQDQKNDVLVASKNYDQRVLTVTANQATVLGIVTLIVFPLLILGAGMFVWLRRRHL